MDTNNTEWQDAEEYHTQKIPSYAGNPLIEALPDILSDEEAYNKMKILPPVDEEARKLESNLRLHHIYLIKTYFQPLSIHLQLQRNFSLAIRSGYIGRNPLHRSFFKDVQDELGIAGKKDPRYGRLEPTSPSFYINGFSGVGKSSGVLAPLFLYPKVIRHRKYKGKEFNFLQIVWLQVDCPHDGSLKGLCMEIFQAIDDLLGTDYRRLYGRNGRAGTDEMVLDIRRLVRLHGIGCLVIDEIQQLSVAKGQGETNMMNFFVNLVNQAGVPIVLIGTPKALPILKKEFQQARRASGIGDIKWYPMSYNSKDEDDDWKILFEELWKYQYVKYPVELTVDFLQALHMASAGIVDFAMKAFILAQFRAIQNGTETLTPDLILSVASDSFNFANDMLNMLRNHQYKEIEKVPDLKLFDLEAHYEELMASLAKQSMSDIRKNKKHTESNDAKSRGAAIQPDGTVQEGHQPKTRGRKSNKAKLAELAKDNYSESDLRYLFASAHEEKRPLSVLLREAGHAKDIAEFLDR